MYNNLFGWNFSWGTTVRHIRTGKVGYVASVYDNGTIGVLVDGRLLIGSVRVNEDFEAV